MPSVFQPDMPPFINKFEEKLTMYQLSLCLLHESTFHLFFKSALCEEHFYPKCFRVMWALWFLAQMGPNNEPPEPSVQHGVKRHIMARRRDRQAFTPTADSPGNLTEYPQETHADPGRARRLHTERSRTPHITLKSLRRQRKDTCSN